MGHNHHHQNQVVLPKGCMAIRVGKEEEEELQRFVVPIEYLNHPLFMDLLKEAEEEYGFKQEGAITIPGSVDQFLLVRDAIEWSVSCRAVHHRHHHRDGHDHRHGLPQFHFTGCFGGGLKA